MGYIGPFFEKNIILHYKKSKKKNTSTHRFIPCMYKISTNRAFTQDLDKKDNYKDKI
jgi:hypothetical protein